MSDGPAIPAFGTRRAMPAESWLDQVSAMDIDGRQSKLEGVDTVADQMHAERQRVTKIAGALLSPEMRPLLEWILDITLRRPMTLPNLGPDAVAFVALREGQNQIAWQIVKAIAEGREERLEYREGT